jgi:hypothetical protein
MGLPVGLIRFKDYLLQKIVPGSSAPPASIKAADLDKNFAMLCLQQDTSAGYDVQIGDTGTTIVPTQTLTVVTGITTTSAGTTAQTKSITFVGHVN